MFVKMDTILQITPVKNAIRNAIRNAFNAWKNLTSVVFARSDIFLFKIVSNALNAPKIVSNAAQRIIVLTAP
jgi:hypothetical protein